MCDCGRATVVRFNDLRSGHTKSCGCLGRERRTTHGRTDTPEYRALRYAIRWCEDPGHEKFPNYGGRGIRVSAAWRRSFPAFFTDLGPMPAPGLTLDRIDPDGDYAPGNCRWATRTEQNRNKRTTRRITAFGRSLTAKEWEEKTGILASTITRRINKSGWPPERAVAEPPRSRSRPPSGGPQ